MKTYLQTLTFLKANIHNMCIGDMFAKQQSLDKFLSIIAFSYNKTNIDVVNDFADLM